MNKPYIKIYVSGELVNPITKEKPYLHSKSSNRGNSGPRYRNIYNAVTGKFMGQVKVNGNNRRRYCKRTGKKISLFK